MKKQKKPDCILYTKLENDVSLFENVYLFL